MQRACADRDERPGRLEAAGAIPRPSCTPRRSSHFLHDHSIEPDSIDLIGFHGQTVLHRPDDRAHGATRRRPLAGAALTGRDVVYDMRAADVAAGGQGAPLVPAYHRAAVEP